MGPGAPKASHPFDKLRTSAVALLRRTIEKEFCEGTPLALPAHGPFEGLKM